LLWGNKPSFRQGSSYTMDYELKSLRIFLLPAYLRGLKMFYALDKLI
jgi:hypothetical protein